MTDSYFTTDDGVWFFGTPFARGPWDVNACHAGPPTSLLVRAVERLVPSMRLGRIWIDLDRPIPMGGFRVETEISRSGRTATRAVARILDDEMTYATARSLHLRTVDELEVESPEIVVPDFEAAVPGPFPIAQTVHGEQAFPSSIEIRYDPASSQGEGGPTTLWMRTVSILPDEEPSGAQRICPLADCGNGISYNGYLDRVLFINPDLAIALTKEPQGEWFCSRSVSHWQPDGTGLAQATMFDQSSMVGSATQSLLLTPVG